LQKLVAVAYEGENRVMVSQAFEEQTGEEWVTTPYAIVETAGRDRFISNPTADAVHQPINSTMHALDSEAVLITKEFDLGTPLEKVIREIQAFARLYEGSRCDVSVITNLGTRVAFGTFTGGTDFETQAVKQFRALKGAMKRVTTFRVELRIVSPWNESIKGLSVQAAVIGKPRFPRPT
jgi:hypothetical protein